MKENPIERRKNKRFSVEVGSLSLRRKNSSEKLGKITDISRSGLAYRYINKGEQFDGPSEFDIFWAGNSFRPLISDLFCETIFDFTVSKDSLKHFFGFNEKRARGVQFRELNEHQISQLEYCIQKHTIIER